MTGAGRQASGVGTTTPRYAAPIWRRAILCVLPVGLLLAAGCLCAEEHDRLGDERKKQGFELLFDGESMDRWRNYRAEGVRPKWKIIKSFDDVGRDGAMVMTEKGGGDLITKEQYGCFDLRLEYRIAKGGNSGVMFRVTEETQYKWPWKTSPEFQLFEGRTRVNRCAGALYGLVESKPEYARPADQWNEVRILLEPAEGDTEHLQAWLNETKTIDLIVDHSPDSEWSRLIRKRNEEKKGTKFELPEEFFRAETGHILLQDHGARVAFRSIRIRRLAETRGNTPSEKEK